MIPLLISKNDKMLIFSPHPDDESIGTGGLLALFPSQCTVVVATDGGKANKSINQEEMAHTRRKEFEAAMSIAGVDSYKMLSFPDGELIQHPNCFSGIRFGGYTKVFLPYKGEQHPDHLSVNRFALDSIRRQGLDGVEVYQYETREPIGEADYYLDISNLIQTKMKMISCYSSQMALFDHASFAEAINHYHACLSGKSRGHFEAYIRLNLDEEQEKENNMTMSLSKYRRKNDYLQKWLSNKISGKEIYAFLRERGYYSIALYGFGYIGRLLYTDLNRGGIDIPFVLDEKVTSQEGNQIEIKKPTAKYDDIEAVIITTLFENQSIKDKLSKLGYQNIWSLWDVLMEMEREKNCWR